VQIERAGRLPNGRELLREFGATTFAVAEILDGQAGGRACTPQQLTAATAPLRSIGSGYGYAPAPVYGYAPGCYEAPTVDVGIGFGGYYAHGAHRRY
jgi:hypothetical protein